VLAATWLLSRAVLVLLLLGPQAWVGGDVSYFDASLAAAADTGLAGTLVEYPLPAVGVVAVPWVLAPATGVSYAVLLLLAAALTDLAYTVLVARSTDRWWPPVAWVAAVPLLGTTAYARFDLLPGVLAGAAVLLLASRPRVAGALVATATAVKLWPVLLVPALVAAGRPRNAVLWAGAVTGGVLLAASVAAAGWGRLLAPLTYQAERGLQIESVAATPVMAGWLLAPGRWTVHYAPSNAFEVTGPGVDLLLAVSTLATVLYVAGLGLACRWLWRARESVRTDTVVWWSLAAVTGFVVTGKVLSPQYLLWLLPIAVAGLVLADGRVMRLWVTGLLAAAALTQVVFPTTYGAVTTGLGAPPWVPVLALALRNAAMLALLVAAVVRLRRLLERDQRGMALERQPPDPDGWDARTAR
jgi:Glycosyltransferase family 87